MLFDNLEQLIEEKYINVSSHESDSDFKIYNYSQNTQFKRHWNETTLNCRGLIAYKNTIVARGPKKFFNIGEVETPPIEEAIGVYEKVDGSLGIPYNINGTLHIATRGAFHSAQAQYATELLYEYNDDFFNIVLDMLEDGLTPIFEIIYPNNQVVVNYGDRDELVYIGTVNNKTGIIDFESHREIFEPHCTLVKKYTINDKIPENSEGFVVQFADGLCIKVKSDWYIKLHRIVANRDFHKMVLESLMEEDFKWLEDVPDEFYKEIHEIKSEYENRLNSECNRITALLMGIKEKNKEDKEIAIEIQKHKEDQSFLFNLWRKDRGVLEKLLLKSFLNEYRKSNNS